MQGRCNRSRELNKKFNDEKIKGNVYIIKIKRNSQFDHSYIYDKEEMDTKIKETGNILDQFLNYGYEHVLEYYNAVSKNLNKIHDIKEDNFVSWIGITLNCGTHLSILNSGTNMESILYRIKINSALFMFPILSTS